MPKMWEVTGGHRKWPIEELYEFYASAHNIGLVKTRRVRWMGHVPWVVEKRRAYGVIVGNLSDRDHLED